MANTQAEEIIMHVCSFLIWTSGVAAVTWFICTRCFQSNVAGASDDYFAGGRALKWFVVAGSLMLTNLSTEQLVGLNGSIFADGCLDGIWWEMGAALAMVISAVWVVPRYFALGLTTTSGFLGDRYDLVSRTLVSLVFLVYYSAVLCPLVLYTGAMSIREIFDLHSVPLWTISTLIGLVGAAYALFGGLKAVAVSDCLNGIGLVIAGVWVPIAALQYIGGINGLFDKPELLRPLVEKSEVFHNDEGTRSVATPSLPWHVTMTGLTLNNLYYWSTNQVIVQRVLAAKTLADGQKGVLFAATMKVVGFTFLCLPGLIGTIMVQRGVEVDGQAFTVNRADEIYPALVKAVLPRWSLGFFAAVLLGSVLSTYNSALNSSSTIFGLEIYQIYINPAASEERVVRVATVFGASLTLISFLIAPMLASIDSIFGFLQQMNTIVSLPIVTIFFIGIATSMPDAFAAKVGFAVGVLACGCGQLFTNTSFGLASAPFHVHYLHVFFISFLVAATAMAMVTYLPSVRVCFGQAPQPNVYQEPVGIALVDMRRWGSLYHMSFIILILMVVLTVALQFGLNWLFYTFLVLWILSMLILFLMPLGRNSQAAAADNDANEVKKDKESSSKVQEEEEVVRAAAPEPARDSDVFWC
jgi:SSS family solute:Na+ symporter